MIFWAILTNKAEKGNNITVFVILKNVCAFANCLAEFPGDIFTTAAMVGPVKKITKTAVPITLNIRCTSAALLAVLLAPTLESIAVTHVPMLVPSKIGNDFAWQ